MMWAIKLLFNPPPMPEIDLPMHLSKVPGIMTTLAKAYELVYYRGVFDGFIAGALLALIFVPLARKR